jgi:hypothetical protein
VLLAVGGSAFAQQGSDERQWSFAPYLWAAGIDGDVRVGPIDADIDFSFGDIVDVLAGAAIFHFEAQNDRHGFFGDFVYLALEPDTKPLPLGGSFDTKVDSTIIELGYLWKGRGSRSDQPGVEFGLRQWDFDTELRTANVGTFDRSTDWTDFFVGYRGTSDVGANWRSISRINIGSGGSDFALGADVTFLRELDSGNAVAIGLKVLTVDEQDLDGVPFEIDTGFAGMTIGYIFR